MIKKILMLLVVVIVAIAAIASLQPDDFRVTRSAFMKAPPQAVFDQVNNLHSWEAWSPWAKLDPNAKNSYEGPVSGTGAVFSWAGNHEVGEGRMTIIESRANELVRFKLDFIKPFSGTNTAEFNFKPQGEQTEVTWSMYGPNTFVGKVIGLFMNCEKIVGGQFEKGLAQLKQIVESKPAW